MGQYWSDKQLDSITPPQVLDARGRATIRALDALLSGPATSQSFVRDPATCPADALPALLAEMSMEEFITPDLPEHVQRRILKNAWLLQSLEGYDAGVELGLSLLGMQMLLKHWHQETPKGPANTHTITFLVGETFFDEDVILGPRIIAAAHRMITATKRLSQESNIRIGANMQRDVRLATAASSLQITRPRGTATRPTAFKRILGIAPAAAMIAIVRPNAEAKRPSHFRTPLGVTAAVSITQINRFSAQAA
jgi:phage tail P2-like protein